jgi:hypothetical protein
MAKFSISGESYEIVPAEVVEVNYSDTTTDLLYSITTKIRDYGVYEGTTSETQVTAIPLNISLLRVPIKGELVLLLKTIAATANVDSGNTTIYYIDVISLQNNVHNNALPTLTNIPKKSSKNTGSDYNKTSSGIPPSKSDDTVDPDFVEKSSFSNLQHYTGDVLVQSRHGASIRFSSILESYSKYKKLPDWSGGNPGDPITVLRNTRSVGSPAEFTNENVNTDDSTFILTSGQDIKITPASDIFKSATKYDLTAWKNERFGKKSLALLTSDRVLINAKTSELLLFSGKGVSISSKGSVTIDSKEIVSINANKIELGTEAKEPVPLGTELKNWLSSLIDDIGTVVINTPQGPAAPINTSPQWPVIVQYKTKIDSFLSDTIFTTKKTNS